MRHWNSEVLIPSAVVLSADVSNFAKDAARLAIESGYKNIFLCDGANDEVELTRAVSFVSSGGLIHLTLGKYNIVDTTAANLPIITTSGVVIEGEGWGTNLQFSTNVGSDRKMFIFQGSSNYELIGVGIRDLRITAYGAQHHGIEMGGVGFGFIQNCYLHHLGTEDGEDEAIFLTGGTNANRFISVDNNTIQGKWGHGLEFGGKNIHCSVDKTSVRQVVNDGINFRSTDAANPPEHITIQACHLVDNTDHGIRIAEGNWISISGCTITDNGKHGIRILDDDCNYISITDCPSISANDWSGIEALGGKGHIIANNHVFNNGLDESTTPRVQGIYIDTDEVIVRGNRCYDTRAGAARTQQHGIYTDTNATLTQVYGNFLDNNETAEASFNGTSETVRNNKGWVTENSDTGSVASGTTTDVITHGLSVTPTIDDIVITWAEQGDNDYGRWWVDTITSTQFTVNVSADPGASNLDFGWSAKVL